MEELVEALQATVKQVLTHLKLIFTGFSFPLQLYLSVSIDLPVIDMVYVCIGDGRNRCLPTLLRNESKGISELCYLCLDLMAS
jgi:hypothetical protein